METVTKMVFVFVTLVTRVTIVKFKYQSAAKRHAVNMGVMVAIAFFLVIIFAIAAMDGWERIANIQKIGSDEKRSRFPFTSLGNIELKTFPLTSKIFHSLKVRVTKVQQGHFVPTMESV